MSLFDLTQEPPRRGLRTYVNTCPLYRGRRRRKIRTYVDRMLKEKPMSRFDVNLKNDMQAGQA